MHATGDRAHLALAHAVGAHYRARDDGGRDTHAIPHADRDTRRESVAGGEPRR